MEENKKLEQTNKLTKKSKIITSLILLSELLFIFEGPKLYGVLIFMITIAIIFIILDKDDTVEKSDDEIKIIKNSITKEINLIEKSTKKLNYELASKDKLNEIIKFVENINEKYLFIKKNYERNRGMDTLTKLINELKTLEKNLKEINDKLLTFYVSETNDKSLNEDLDHIINQLDAQKIL